MTDLIPLSSPWWVERLGKELDARAVPMKRLDDYYRGRHPLLYAGGKFRAAFGDLFSGFSDNFCALVADAVDERLDVEGFRMGASRELEADSDAWRIWQTNDLDAWSQIGHIEALVKGMAYVLVWADEDDDETPEITVQDALEVTVAIDPASHDRLAGFKRWTADDGTVMGTLYLPDRIEKYQVLTKNSATAPILIGGPLFVAGRYDWIRREVPGEPWPLTNPLGEVPIVPLVNRPRLRGDGESEIAQVIPDQNAVNKLVLDMLVASEFAGFRQRWVTGLEIPYDPDTGQPIEPFHAAVDRLFIAEDPNVKFGEFGITDLANYVKAIEMLIQHIASTSRTPPHYLLGQSGSFPSGESLKSTETGLVAKARRKQRVFGESWEEVIRLAFKVLGDPRGEIEDSETIWRDPESRTEAEHTDAVVKMGSAPIEVPQEVLWEKLGFSPQEIARMKEMKAAEPPPPPPPDMLAMASGGGRNGMPTDPMMAPK
jgi:hypothetical protein